MKFLIVSLALVAAAAAADVPHVEAAATVLRAESDVHPEGFSSVYETSNGISAQAQGVLKAIGQDVALDTTGSFQYTSPEGIVIQVTYRADENGFQPQGAHLPTSPPAPAIPDYILRSIQYNAEHAAKEIPQTYQAQPTRRF